MFQLQDSGQSKYGSLDGEFYFYVTGQENGCQVRLNFIAPDRIWVERKGSGFQMSSTFNSNEKSPRLQELYTTYNAYRFYGDISNDDIHMAKLVLSVEDSTSFDRAYNGIEQWFNLDRDNCLSLGLIEWTMDTNGRYLAPTQKYNDLCDLRGI